MDMLMGQSLVRRNGDKISAETALKNVSVIIYYFCAEWCENAICEQVLTLLKKVHQENLRRKKNFQIIFVSSDNDEASFLKFFKTHADWLAIPNNDFLAETLRRSYSITTIPTIIVVRKNGDVVTNMGNSELIEKGINVLVTWAD